MMTFSFEELLAANVEDRNVAEVEVVLGKALVRKRAELVDAIAAAESSQPKRATVKNDAAVKLKGELDELMASAGDAAVLLRFREVPSEVWAEFSSRFDARVGVKVDMLYGYDVQRVCKAAAEWKSPSGELFGGRVVDGELVELVVERDGKGRIVRDDWSQLFKALSAPDLQRVIETIFAVNVGQAEQEARAFLKSFGVVARSAN